jgi:hypothetical protein
MLVIITVGCDMQQAWEKNYICMHDDCRDL